MGGFFGSTKVNAMAKKSAEKNYIESEAVAKIAPEADIDGLAGKYNLTASLLKTKSDGNLYVLKSGKNISTEKIIKLLENDPAIISVQPNFRYRPLSRAASDRYFPRQWTLTDTSENGGGTGANAAWDLETKNQTGVPIAIIDSGVNYKHSDIKDMIAGGRAKGKNFVSPKKKPTDSDGHGTFLAGIIAAKTNNRKGVSGASFFNKFKIMPLKFDFTTMQAISALSYAKARNIPIVNASWGEYGNEGLDPFLKDAIAAYPGVFVTASGNGDCDSSASGAGCDHDSGNPGDRMYPCDFDLPNILCVGATDRSGNLTNYSDYGAVSVDVSAPGGTDSDPIIGLGKKKNTYEWMEGSSISTAYVSAEAGLILSKYPHLGTSQIIEIIKSSVDVNPSLSEKVSSGGKVNFRKALDLAAGY